MAISKVVYGGQTLMDLTGDSVTPQNMIFGTTAHNAAGESITGAVVTADIDKTLEIEGAAADAKAVGDALTAIVSPIEKRTFNNIYCEENNANACRYFFKIRAATWYTQWWVHYKISASVGGVDDSIHTSEVWITGNKDVMLWYNSQNAVNNSSYKAYYHHTLYRPTLTGYDAGYGALIGLRFQYSYNPHVAANARTIVIELLGYGGGELEWFDELPYYTDIDGNGTVNFTAVTNIDAVTNGFTHAGDRDTKTQVLVYYTHLVAGANGIKNRSLVMQDSSGKWQSFTTTSGIGTTKPRNTTGFKLGKIYFWLASTDLAANKKTSDNTLNVLYHNIDLRYSTNCGTTLIAEKDIYIKGTYNQQDGLFYLAETWWTQELPTSDDGYIYIYLGVTNETAYQISADLSRTPIYYYKDGAIRLFTPDALTKVDIDSTLSTSGKVADAKATGDALALKLDISKIVPITAAEIDALFT